ncbi:hypothetical protein, partial [Pseudomonas sp. GW456-R21]|uniref:hypothetical protein n=1 Tax=Pseudomonas sp. GW456-R21 TaxID=2075554 RepID=UPI000CD3A554
RQEEARARRAHLVPLAEAARRYGQLHGDAKPVGLREALYRQSRELDDESHRLTQEESRLRELHQAWLAFRDLSEQAPEAWLKDAKVR